MTPSRIQPRSVQGQRLPRWARLTGQKLIRSIIAQRSRYSDGTLSIYVAPNPFPYPRLGISVAKACGKAVVRNRLKRLIREAFRLDRTRIPAGLDYLVVVNKKGLANLTLDQVRTSLLRLGERAAARSTNQRPGIDR